MNLYLGMDRTQLDAAYNNSAAVADSARILADWQARSDRVRAAHPRYLDLRYGDAERNRIDYFVAHRDAPVLVFIHGGYWQMRAKENFAFLAAGPLAHGINVALVAYTLAPDKRLTGIVAEIREAIAWLITHLNRLGGDPRRLYVSGWSAGGHLTALALDESRVKGGLAVSGIYDLEPMRLCYINDKLNLDEREVRELSPLSRLPKGSAPLVLAYGGSELPELQRQSENYAAARARHEMPSTLAKLAGHNHFTILEELADPDGALTGLVRELVGY